MCRRLALVTICALMLGGFNLSVTYAGDPSLVGWWKLDEGSGTTALDSSDYGNHGTLVGDPQWVVGMIGSALEFDGTEDAVEIPHSDSLSITDAITIAAWTYMADGASGEMAVVSKGRWGANDLPYELTEEAGAVIFWQFYDDAGRDTCAPDSPAVEEWHHIAATYDGSVFKCYIDAVLADEWGYAGTMPENERPVTIGRRSGGGTFYQGLLDEVVMHNRALDGKEIVAVMLGRIPELAAEPSPEDEAIDILRDTALGWAPGEFAQTHDVYLGTVFDDVNEADRADPRGVLVSQGQNETIYVPNSVLEFGQTYYWRIDEVNAAPDSTIYKGVVWSFTVEPFAYPVEDIVATSNATSNAGEGPENTINGSGLDENDLHSTRASEMWLGRSDGADSVWIQYEFDRVYKLHEMLVWNYNVEFELVLGFGIKTATVEYSENGVDWIALGDVELTQGTAKSDYAANTTVAFGGVAAKYVKLTVSAGFGALPQYGLSEVRLLFIPAHAREPQPADGAVEVDINPVLSWRAGREAVSHEVYVSADAGAVADGTAAANTVSQSSFAPADLAFGVTYTWRVDEVNEADAISTWEGSLWSFTVQEFAAIDDFESYDDVDNAIFDTWLDGWVNSTGSTVGYLAAPFAERAIVHGGDQSMPLGYNNADSPLYSEASRAWASAQDWASGGADSIRLYFYGDPGNTAETLYVAVEDSAGTVAIAAYPDSAAVTTAGWQEWVIPFSELSGVNFGAVKVMYIGLGDRENPVAGGSGTVFVDDIGFGRPVTAE